MDDHPHPSRLPPLEPRHPLWSALRLWWRAWRAAGAAEDAYAGARAEGAAQGVAAHEAFKALTVNDLPPRTEMVSGAQGVAPSTAIRPRDSPDATLPLGGAA